MDSLDKGDGRYEHGEPKAHEMFNNQLILKNIMKYLGTNELLNCTELNKRLEECARSELLRKRLTFTAHNPEEELLLVHRYLQQQRRIHRNFKIVSLSLNLLLPFSHSVTHLTLTNIVGPGTLYHLRNFENLLLVQLELDWNLLKRGRDMIATLRFNRVTQARFSILINVPREWRTSASATVFEDELLTARRLLKCFPSLRILKIAQRCGPLLEELERNWVQYRNRIQEVRLFSMKVGHCLADAGKYNFTSFISQSPSAVPVKRMHFMDASYLEGIEYFVGPAVSNLFQTLLKKYSKTLENVSIEGIYYSEEPTADVIFPSMPNLRSVTVTVEGKPGIDTEEVNEDLELQEGHVEDEGEDDDEEFEAIEPQITLVFKPSPTEKLPLAQRFPALKRVTIKNQFVDDIRELDLHEIVFNETFPNVSGQLNEEAEKDEND